MESKPKKRQVRKASSAIPAPQKSAQPQAKSAESLISDNSRLVSELFASEPWREIAFPLLQESIASVSGRYTNGRYYHGLMVKDGKTRDFLAGYQLALEEFNNRLNDFIVAKNNLDAKLKQEKLEKDAPFVNTFVEEYEAEH